MDKILIIFGYKMEVTEDSYTQPFYLYQTLIHSLKRLDRNELTWSYSFRPVIELHTNDPEKKQLACMSNYTVIQHLIRGSKFLQDTWESQEPLKKEDE